MGDSCGTGACASGTVQCNGTGDGLSCSTEGSVATETCNDTDDDCDGSTDEEVSGSTCCTQDSDCSAFDLPSVCNDASTCQGTRQDGECQSYACISGSPVADDTGCGATTVANECGAYDPAMCNAQADQSTPSCETSCSDDSACDDTAACLSSKCAHQVCELTGSAGETAECQINLARAAQGNDEPVSVSFTLAYDADDATVSKIVPCSGTCTEHDPDATGISLTTGHSVRTCAQSGGTCTTDRFQMLIFGTDSDAITSAYVDGGSVSGSPTFMKVKFTLVTDGPHKVLVDPSADMDAANATARLLELEAGHKDGGSPAHWLQSGAQR